MICPYCDGTDQALDTMPQWQDSGHADIVVGWAEEMAQGSKEWSEEEGWDMTDTVDIGDKMVKYVVYQRSPHFLGWLLYGWYVTQIIEGYDEVTLKAVTDTIKEFTDRIKVVKMDPPIPQRFYFKFKGKIVPYE